MVDTVNTVDMSANMRDRCSERSYCYITVARGQEIKIEFSFHSGFIAKLKNLVPAQYRSYDSANKIWTVHPRYERQIIELVKAHFERAWLMQGAATADLHTGEVS